MIWTIKAVIRWLRYQIRWGVAYHSYSRIETDSHGYLGWYEARDSCLAFRKTDGRLQFRW